MVMLASATCAPIALVSMPAAASQLSDAYNRETDLPFRRGLQMRLAWTGDYAGAFDGDIDSATLRAVRDFQARHGLAATGVIDDAMLRLLVSTSDGIRNPLGVADVEDPRTGITLPLPTMKVSERGASEVGSLWASEDGRIEIETVRIAGTGQTLPGLYDVLSQPTERRSVDEKRFDGLTFEVAGTAEGRRYVMHFSGLDDDLRGFSVTFDEADAPSMEAYATVAAASFDPFAGTPEGPAVASNDTDGARELAVASNESGSNLFSLPSQFIRNTDARADTLEPPVGPLDMSGSGFVVSKDGWVLTNAHVVKACKSVLVGDKGSVVKTIVDPANDLALVKLDTAIGTPLKIVADKPRLGEDVLALGFPLRSILADSLNVTRGNVSSLLGLRNDPRYLQISAAVQPGNSGGPLIDLAGRVVGVVTAKLNAVAVADATGDIPQSINFAIRPDVAAAFLKKNGVAFEVADPKAEATSVPDATASVKDSVLPVLCLGG
ncbi:serine protease [Aurantimonas sp. Leaf443]|nr:serine protease [Aurantimonas sp. Leaf443]